MQHWPWYLLIDEAFVDLRGVPGCLVGRSQKVRERILQWVGIPCCVGLGSTKTLAKLANFVAKSAERKPGSYPPEMAQVCNLATLTPSALQEVFATTAVSEVWGVGQRLAAQLKASGVHTVRELARLEPSMVRRRWSVVLERTVRELQGMPCISLELAPARRQEIACTRSFGQPLTHLAELSQAVTEFASRAAHRLRVQGSLAGQVLVFIRSSPFRAAPQFSRSITTPLRRPSADTGMIVSAALRGLGAIYRPGYQLAKAGVMLLELHSSAVLQGELDLQCEVKPRTGDLMASVDELNARYGRGTVRQASAGVDGSPQAWAARQERRTPAYTTCLADIPVARA